MQIIARSQLAAVMTSDSFDPDQQFNEEMTAFAAAILAHCPTEYTHFVFTDHENGGDPEVSWGEGARVTPEELVPLTWRQDGGSYYGLTSVVSDFSANGQPIYHCYLGGSPLNSAPGFVLTPATLYDSGAS